MEQSLDPDHALVLACQQRDVPRWSDPFRLLHDRHKEVVHSICLQITGDANDALDAAQEAFILAFRGIEGFRFRSRFSRWLCRIATHVSLERWRRHSWIRFVPELDEQELGLEPQTSTDPHAEAEQEEWRELIRRALGRLTPRMREILVLRYFENLSYEELGSRLSIAPGSVRSRLHRAHSALSWRLLALAEEGE